jgi:hypothetical protein
MSTALVPFEKLQVGIETVAGTAVPATKVIATEDGGDYTHDITRTEVNEISGVFVARDDVDLVEIATLGVRHVLDFEQVLLPLLTGIESVAGVGTPLVVWTFEPSMAAPADLDTATFEVSYTDGTTRHVEEEFAFGQCRSFNVNLAFNELAMLEAEYFGRAPGASTFTTSLAVPARELIASNRFGVYIDDTWAGLGTTQVSGLVRSATLSMETGVAPNYTLDGQTNIDHTKIRRGRLSGTLALTMEVDAAFAAELAKFKSGALRFFMLKATGADGREISFGLSGRYVTSPDYSVDDTLRLAQIELAVRYDPTSAKAFQAIVKTPSLATF